MAAGCPRLAGGAEAGSLVGMEARGATPGNLQGGKASQMLRMGLVTLAVALGLAIACLKLGAGAPWRALLVVPFFIAAAQLLQGVYGTCAWHAQRQERATDEGTERVADPAVAAAQRALGLRLMARAAMTAVAVTALFVLAP